MEWAGGELNRLLRGVVPMGDFWMMTKLKAEMSLTELGTHPDHKEILRAALTINRFRSLTGAQRSLDIIKVIQTSLKGD